MKEPPAGIEPAPRPYKGRVLAVDTTEARVSEWRRSESNRHLPRCKRGARPVELHPRGADGWSRTTTARRRQGYSLLSSPLLSVRMERGWPAGLEPAPAGLTTPGASVYTTATTKAGTTGLEPAASRLTSECSARLSYAPGERGGRRDRLPATGDRDVAVWSAPEPAVAHRRSCQRVSAPPPPHRLALEACRSQLHVRARALHQPLFRHSLSQPVGQPIFKLSFFRRGCRLCRRPLAAALVRAKSSCFGEAEADFGR